jgi:hypothetical protein
MNEVGDMQRGYDVKASAFRAYIAQISRLGLLADISAHVGPETRRLIEAPPLPSSWMDAGPIEEMIGALATLRGLETVRAVTRAGQQTAGLTLLRPVVTALLRLFGATPSTVFSRFGDITKTALRGVSFQWESDTPSSGRLTVAYPRPNTPRHAFIGMESGCWITLDVCGVSGTVADTEIAADGSTGVIRVRW